MYIPSHFQETDTAVLQALVRSHPLGAWVTQADGALIVNHLPFLLDPSTGEFGTLVCHVARANPVWQQFSRDVSSVVIFQGAESYISPSWYATKEATGKVVPTWNYAVVHAHGIPRVMAPDRLLAHVTALTDAHESTQEQPWRVTDAPAGFVESLLNGIVGIEIPIVSLTGKWKVSQNRPEADRRSVEAALRARGDGRSQTMADLIIDALTDRAGND